MRNGKLPMTNDSAACPCSSPSTLKSRSNPSDKQLWRLSLNLSETPQSISDPSYTEKNMNWTFRRKMLAGFMAIMILTIGLSAFALTRMSKLQGEVNRIGMNSLPALGSLGEARAKLARLRIRQIRYVSDTNDADRARTEASLNSVIGEIDAGLKEYEPTITGPEEQQIYETLKSAYGKYLANHREIEGFVKSGNSPEGEKLLMGPMKQGFDNVEKPMTALFDYQLKGGANSVHQGELFYKTGRLWILIILAAVIVFGMTFALWFSSVISRALIRAVSISRDLAKGILSDKVEVKTSDETGQLIRAMNDMTEYLSEMVSVSDRIAAGDLSATVEPRSNEDRFGASFKKMLSNLRASIQEISVGSNQVATTSSHIASASDDAKTSAQSLAASSDQITATIHQMAASVRQVSSNAQTQSAAATETSAAITEMVASLQGIAENTRRLSTLTNTASDAARQGQQTLGHAAQSMHKISTTVDQAGKTINTLGARAESIGKIVETIDDIADQTNLLALNAAIEAARAGEHGLGFAVVADEVRKLAERSARSTREIGDLIETIQKESRAAVSHMDESNKTVRDYIANTSVTDALARIMEAIESIVLFTQEIEAATSEQSSGAEEIARSTQNLSELTMKISSATEEQSQGAAEVVRAMEQLGEVVKRSVQMATGLQDSAEQLYQQSDVLHGVVGRFNIGSEAMDQAQAIVADPSVLRMNGHHHQVN
jgi:methyl-accepting chemotaxis protein